MLVFLALCGFTQCRADNLISKVAVADDDADARIALMLLQQHVHMGTASRAIQPSLEEWGRDEQSSGFAGRPAEDAWPNRWQDIIRQGAKRPCKARITSLASAYKSKGLGSQLHLRIFEYMFALYGNFGLSMLMHPAPQFKSEVVESHFDNPAGISICRKPVPHFQKVYLFALSDFFRNLSTQQLDYSKRLMRFVAPNVLSYKADIKNELDQRLMSMGLGASPYVGVHIRHGDKNMEAKLVPTKRYAKRFKQLQKQRGLVQASIQAIRTALDETGARTVFLATDDASALGEMQQALGADIEIKVQSGVDFDRDYTQGEALIDFLTDLEALRRSAIFICTGSSNVAKIVWAMRPGTPNDADIINLENDPTFPLHFF